MLSNSLINLIQTELFSMKQITFKQYRNIDLTILCILTAVFEAIAAMASDKWFNLQAMTVSITLALTCITFMRWSLYALFPSFIGAFVYCTVIGGTLHQYLIYCGGSLFIIIAFPLLQKITKEKVRKDFFFKLVFACSVYVSLTAGRWYFSLPFEFSFKTFLTFLGTDILSLLFAIVVLGVAKNIDGLIEDQKSYLLRLEKERKEEQEANLNDPF